MDATNVTISELTTQMMNEARRLGFSEATIWRNWMHRAGMVITYYRERGVCLYDPAVTEAFVQETRQRCKTGIVSKNYLKQILQITGRLNEFFLTGTLRMDTTVHGTRYELMPLDNPYPCCMAATVVRHKCRPHEGGFRRYDGWIHRR